MKNKRGFIILIDALGIKNLTIQQSKKFIDLRESLIKVNHEKLSKAISAYKGISEVEYATFGDTIIFAWEINDEEKFSYLPFIGTFLNTFMYSSLVYKVFWRGAISYGDYFFDSDSNTFLGPAITDVASWYESSNFIGIIGTPNFYFLVNELIKMIERKEKESDKMKKILEGTIEEINGEFIEYCVPMKTNKDLKTIVCNWPKKVVKLSTEKEGEELISNLFQECVSKGAEDKYYNSLKFFKECNK